MQDRINQHFDEIVTLCQRYGVIRLIAFEAKADVLMQTSRHTSVYFIVEFKRLSLTIATQNRFAVQQAMNTYLRRAVRLIEYNSADQMKTFLQDSPHRVIYSE